MANKGKSSFLASGYYRPIMGLVNYTRVSCKLFKFNDVIHLLGNLALSSKAMSVNSKAVI